MPEVLVVAVLWLEGEGAPTAGVVDVLEAFGCVELRWLRLVVPRGGGRISAVRSTRDAITHDALLLGINIICLIAKKLFLSLVP